MLRETKSISISVSIWDASPYLTSSPSYSSVLQVAGNALSAFCTRKSFAGYSLEYRLRSDSITAVKLNQLKNCNTAEQVRYNQSLHQLIAVIFN